MINTNPMSNPTSQLNSNYLLKSNINFTHEVIQQKNFELSSKIKETFNQNQKNKFFSNQAQLESFNINLITLDILFTSENVVMRYHKSIDQLFALSTNLKKDLQDKIPEQNLANLFLSQNGITLAKTEKEISDLDRYVQNKYDLTTDVKKIPVSEKFHFNDYARFSQVVQTNMIRKNINEIVQHQERKNRKVKRSGLDFYSQLIGAQYEDMKRVDCIRQDESIEYSNYYEKSEKYSQFDKSNLIPRQVTNITPMKNKIFENGLKLRTERKQTPKSTGYMLNNLRKNQNLVTSLNEDESVLSLFDSYFNTLKYYFHYKMKGDVLSETGGFFFNQTEIQKFNHSKEKSNFLPVCIAVNDLVIHFESTSDNYRRSIFDLLMHQLNPVDKSPLTVNKMLINTVSYYEKEFFKKIFYMNFSGDSQNVDLGNLDYNTKIKVIENYVNTIIYGKLIANRDNNMIDSLRLWGMIYYLVRSGLEAECMKFLSVNRFDSQIKDFEYIYSKFIREEPLEYEDYANLLEIIKYKSENEINPFRHCLFVMMSKVNKPVDDNIFESMEDYIWFHLKLIIEKPNYEKFKTAKKLSTRFLTLKEFQDFIKKSGPESFEPHSNIHLDYLKCLFSLLLFEDGVDYLITKKEHLIDSVNISFLLQEISLLRNFHVSDMTENVLAENNTNLYHQNENDYIINKLADIFTETFMHSRLFAILIYIKYYYKENYLEKFANVIMTTGNNSHLLNPKELNFSFRNTTYSLLDLLSEKEITSLVSVIISTAVSTPPEIKTNFDILIKLAKNYKMYKELLELVINDSIEILTAKTPKKIFKSEIHSKPSHVNPSAKVLIDPRFAKTLVEKNRDVLEEIGANISSFESKFRLNFKFLRQLENVEEIYDYILKENYNKGLDTFIKSVTLIPFKTETEVVNFMNNEYLNINEQLKKVIPDVIYLLFFLLTKKVNELNTSYNLKRNENNQNVKNEIDRYKSYLTNISNFVDNLSNSRVLKNSEKYKEITRMINDFSMKF